ncbi:MAG: VCBS repeat-containing protein [Deltaproteobacteria bacterium]|nr:VCBS repeat-containing protein [Deltaproteobacteria bacterium]
MAITLGLNISALRTTRYLGRADSDLSTVFERLSSGQRINRAADDAAGLAIGMGLTSGARVLRQGVRNLNDGLSYLNIADSTLEQLNNVVTRLIELAEQSANGSLGYTERKALNLESKKLKDEYVRLVSTSTFNGRNVFDGTQGQLRLQAGVGIDGGIGASMGGAVGSGSFASLGYHSIATNRTTRAQTADLNGDGNVDLVSGGNGKLIVELGNGDGTFTASTEYATTGIVQAVRLADINSDGILDMVAAAASDIITARLGQGNGTFGSETVVGSSVFPTGASLQLELGDLNGDGKMDFVATSSLGEYQAYLGDGKGSFSAQGVQTFNDGGGHFFHLSDANNDGVLDIISTYSNGGLHAEVKLGQGNGTFGASVDTLITSGVINYGETADLNGDGFADMVTMDGSTGNAIVALGDGVGGFKSSQNLGGIYAAAEVADFNGDGKLDFVAVGDDATFFLGNGDGTFSQGATSTIQLPVGSPNGVQAPSGVSAGDFNNDGVLDLLVPSYSGVGNNGYLEVLTAGTVDGVSALLNFDLSSAAGARQALSQLQTSLSNIAKQRGQIGSFQSRVSAALQVVSASGENYESASARILDVDVAAETAKLARTQILKQAGAAVLAQANQIPALALQLLKV